MHACHCTHLTLRLDITVDENGQRQFSELFYASPVGAYLFQKLGVNVLKLDAEHLKAYYKGQVHILRSHPLAHVESVQPHRFVPFKLTPPLQLQPPAALPSTPCSC